jgi:general stress protein 26
LERSKILICCNKPGSLRCFKKKFTCGIIQTTGNYISPPAATMFNAVKCISRLALTKTYKIRGISIALLVLKYNFMSEVQNLVNAEAIEKLKELANAADICMFTTSLKRLPLSSRPMSTVQVDDEGNIWFLSKKSSEKNKEISKDHDVQLFYASKASAEYLSVYGSAAILTDRKKAEEIWTPIAKAWLTEGVNDPELTIIKVVPKDVYYWDTKSNKLVFLVKIFSAVITGKTMDDGVEGKLKI